MFYKNDSDEKEGPHEKTDQEEELEQILAEDKSRSIFKEFLAAENALPLLECWEAVEERRDEPKQGKIDVVY